jgi:hypothetical protein
MCDSTRKVKMDKCDIENEILLLDGVLSRLKNKEDIMVEVFQRMALELKRRYNQDLEKLKISQTKLEIKNLTEKLDAAKVEEKTRIVKWLREQIINGPSFEARTFVKILTDELEAES